jgi:antirestriction protein
MNTRESTITRPRIYVACLSAYNNGYLHGAWIDIEDFEQVWDEIAKMLTESPMAKEEICEEWAIHDFEGFGSYKISESHDLEELCAVAEFIQEAEDKFPSDVISFLVDDFGIEGAKDRMENDYIGEFDSDTDFSYHYVEEFGLLDGRVKTNSHVF